MSPEQGTSPEIPENPNRAEAQRALDEDAAKPGAEGSENSDAADTLPGLPADDDSELGSTDQHSDA
jgi:hypothetical protein